MYNPSHWGRKRIKPLTSYSGLSSIKARPYLPRRVNEPRLSFILVLFDQRVKLELTCTRLGKACELARLGARELARLKARL